MKSAYLDSSSVALTMQMFSLVALSINKHVEPLCIECSSQQTLIENELQCYFVKLEFTRCEILYLEKLNNDSTCI